MRRTISRSLLPCEDICVTRIQFMFTVLLYYGLRQVRAQAGCQVFMVFSRLPPALAGARSLGSRSAWPLCHVLIPQPVARVHATPRPLIMRRSRFCSTSLTSFAPVQPHLHSPSEMAEFRLPTNVQPCHYNLTIKTDLEDLTFEGSASIE